MAAYLTTHVLDTARGQPAAGIPVSLYRVVDGARELVNTAITNDDGRVDGPLAAQDDFKPGIYELAFSAGDYLRRNFTDLPEPLFLDGITLRFGVADSDAHYHVPLLLSPFGYSTYRGS